MEHAFGSSAPFRLGVEEELFLVDAQTLQLAHVSSAVLPRVRAREDVAVMHDTYEAMVETASPVCANAIEAVEALDGARGALRAAGATLLGGGLHPTAPFGDVVHVPQDRYREVHAQTRGLLERTPTAAVHVHVGMPDAETAIRAFGRFRNELPLLQALAAHSPFWHGRDSRFATGRAQMWRGYAGAIIPRAFVSWDEYAGHVAAVNEAGGLPDYTYLYWDVRLHPRLGTVEVRAMDGQARVDAVLGLAALAHALLVRAAHEDDGPPADADVLTQSSYRAGRDGLAATILHRGALRPVPEVARDAIERARPYAAGAEDAFAEVERILAEGNGADRIRAAHQRGGFDAVLTQLAAETAAPLSSVRGAGAARS